MPLFGGTVFLEGDTHMADKKEILQSMLNNLINDNHTEATVDSHAYFSQKMKEVMGGKVDEPIVADTTIVDDNIE